MTNPVGFYEALSEPILTEADRPETVAIDKFLGSWLIPKQRRLFPHQLHHNIDDVVIPDSLLPEVIEADKWIGSWLVPKRRPEFYIRDQASQDMVIFDALFSTATRFTPLAGAGGLAADGGLTGSGGGLVG